MNTAFISSIKSCNYPYVIMGEINEQHYNDDILNRFKGVQKSGNKSTLLHYNTYDWISDDYYIELKSRNNDYNVYNTTMIGYNKVKIWKDDKTNRKYFFLFAFLDGLYEWELNTENYEKISTFKRLIKERSSLSYSTFNQNKEHVYIPINQLKKINDKGCLIPDDLKSKSKTLGKF